MHFYHLIYEIYHKNYNLTINTSLKRIDTEIYNSSFTYIKYLDVNGKSITSMDFVQFNTSVLLSQQYDLLVDVMLELGKIYKQSEALELQGFYYSYINMAEGIKSLSELVKEQLGEYDYHIINSNAIITDPPIIDPPPPPPPPEGCFGGDPYWDCFWCKTAVNAGFIGTCAGILLASVLIPPAIGASLWCLEALSWFLLLMEATAVCMILGCC